MRLDWFDTSAVVLGSKCLLHNLRVNIISPGFNLYSISYTLRGLTSGQRRPSRLLALGVTRLLS